MCCLFGLIDYNNCLSARRKEKIIKILSAECEVRGTDATGVAYIENGKMSIFKRPLPAHKMHFKFKSNPKVIMGHTRMTTQGSERINRNNHPFYSNKLGFALAHNGMFTTINSSARQITCQKQRLKPIHISQFSS
jgi:glucosamine 6-phosphate synthetase-like amidotransferase/phosphosugar isomerase protein